MQLKNNPSSASLGLMSFKFDDRSLSDESMVMAVARMFFDLNLVDSFRINHRVFIINIIIWRGRLILESLPTIYVPFCKNYYYSTMRFPVLFKYCLEVIIIYLTLTQLYQVLLCWILSMKENYCSENYHYWRHAFGAAQTMFTMLKVSYMPRSLHSLS